MPGTVAAVAVHVSFPPRPMLSMSLLKLFDCVFTFHYSIVSISTETRDKIRKFIVQESNGSGKRGPLAVASKQGLTCPPETGPADVRVLRRN